MASVTSANRRILALVSVASLALGLSACSPQESPPTTAPGTTAPTSTAPAGISGNIVFWHFFTDREAGIIQSAVDKFIAANPGVTVDVQSGQDDDKMRTAIAAGQAIDVGLSYSADQVGPLCSTGAFQDLAPYIQRDNVDLGQIPDAVQAYTQFKGVRCSLPMLADVYALYYNKDLLAAAGITTPPKTLDELAADAVKLTTYNADGSIKTLGFMPMMDYYETNVSTMGAAVQAKWLNEDGTSAIGSDPNWQTLFTWQKDLIGKLGGYQKLKDWQSGNGEEFSAENDFQTGRVAMAIDGEFRTAFIADQAPDLKYGTAPMPMSADHQDAYGAGYMSGNVIGIPKGAKNPEAAWALIKFLALDTDAQVLMGNGLKNVPTIKSALTSPNLEVTEQYKTFLTAYASPYGQTNPASIIGATFVDLLGQFAADWEVGTVTDLAAGLKDVDKQIDDAVALGG